MRVDEPLYVSVSVQEARVVLPRPDQGHGLGGQVGRQQGAGQADLQLSLCNDNVRTHY